MRIFITLLCFVVFIFAGCLGRASDNGTLRMKIIGRRIDPNGPSRGTIQTLTFLTNGKYEMVLTGPPKFVVGSDWHIEHGDLFMSPVGDKPIGAFTNVYDVFSIVKLDNHELILGKKNKDLWRLTR